MKLLKIVPLVVLSLVFTHTSFAQVTTLLTFDTLVISDNFPLNKVDVIGFPTQNDTIIPLCYQYDNAFDSTINDFQLKIQEDGTDVHINLGPYSFPLRDVHIILGDFDTTIVSYFNAYVFDTTLTIDEDDEIFVGITPGPSLKYLRMNLTLSQKWPLSVQDIHSVKMKLYPNPTSNLLNIEFENQTPTTYTIIDLKGQEVKKDKFSNSIYVGDLPKGMYFIRLDVAGEMVVKEFEVR